MRFDPQDPFPLLVPGTATYAQEKQHSAEVDAWLGMRIVATEILVTQTPGQENWSLVGPSVFLTPYSEIRKILSELNLQPGDRVVDLGAGYGRMGFVLHEHYPMVKFVGYELVAERVAEGARALIRHRCRNAELVQCDLLQRPPLAAEFYFIYDYGTRAAIEKTLQDLRAIAAKQKITLVGRGRGVRDAIERGHPWLGEVVPPQHRGNYSIYSSG